MDRETKEGKRRTRKSKVGVSNDSFELEEPSLTIQNKVSPFLNNIREAQSKNKLNAKSNALEALVGAKKSVSKWKDFVNRKRIKKKNTSADGEESETMRQRGGIGGLGLDDIHEDFVIGQEKIFGRKVVGKSMSVASNQALLQYFSKLGKSLKENEVIDLDFVETLLKSGADVNCTDKHGQTLLHEVSIKWHCDVAKFLIDLGADINKADNYGRTPLHLAAADDYPEMVELLINRGAIKEALTSGEGQTATHFAARNDATSALKMLIKKGCDYKMVKDYKGRTPLHVAAELDRSETARLLLELEAPAGVSDRQGMTIITWMITKMPPVAAEALEQFHIRDRPNRQQHFYLNLLVQDRKIDPDLKTRTPLNVVVRYKQFDIVTHPVFLTLLNVMWSKFGRWRAYGGILFNLVYILLWTVYGVTMEFDKRYKYILPEHTWRIVLLVAAVGITAWNIIDEIREYRRATFIHEKYKEWRLKEIEDDLKFCHPRWPEEKKFLDSEREKLESSHTRYFNDYWNIFDWITYCMLTVVVATHIADVFDHSDSLAQAHIRLTCVVIIILWIRLMKNIRAFSLLGPFVVMLGAMFQDLIKFGFLYVEFLIPYVCGFWMLYGGTKYPEGTSGDPNRTEITVDGFANFNDALFTMFRLTLVDDYAYDEMKQVDSLMTDIMVGTWLALSAVLCLNLLIALFSDTFQRVYDNAHSNATMQKAILLTSFWDNMSSEARHKFLDFVKEKCSPFSDYYDDDMTEGGESDLKKVTIQIKEQLDDLMEKWHDQFGEEDNMTALEELQQEASKTNTEKHGKMVTMQKFDTEIVQLREEVQGGLLQLRLQQEDMIRKFKQDMKLVKSLLLDLTNSGSGGGGGGGGGSYAGSARQRMGHMEEEPLFYPPSEGSQRPKSGKKKKKSKSELELIPDMGASLPGEMMMTRQSQGLFAQTPIQPVLDVTEQELIHYDPFQVESIPSARTGSHDQDSIA